MVKIGVATDATKETNSSFAAVDLLTDEEVGGNKLPPAKTQDDIGRDSSSSSSAGSESDSDSSSDGSDSDLSSSDSDSDSDDDESTSSSSAGVTTKPNAMETNKNFSSPLKRSVRSSANANVNAKSSERKIPVSGSAPPSSSFKHTKRFPSFGGMRPRKDKGGKHQRLAADENEAEKKEGKVNGNRDGNRNGNGNTREPGTDLKVHDPANFPLEQYTDAEYGLSGKPPDNYSYASADPNNVDYNPRSLRKMDNVDERTHDHKWQGKIIAYGFCCTIVFCLFIMIASIVAFNNHMNVHSAPKDLAEVCSMQSIGTAKGHKHCEKSCKEAECCMASYDSSCFLEQQGVCMEYSPCGTIHTNYDYNTSNFHLVVPPAPVDLEQICSDSNIAVQTGFLDCKAACNPGLCCLPTNVSNSNGIAPDIKACWDTHEDVCQHYIPCKALEGVDENHGSPVDLVNLKCSVHNLKFAEGVEDCGNICQTRSCCFAESNKRNCREDNEVWCNEFAACDQLSTALDLGAGTTDTSTSDNDVGNNDEDGVTTMEDTCKDMAVLDEANRYTCKHICEPATCCFYEDIVCEKHIDCPFYSFCENVISILGDGGGGIDQSPGDVGIACADISTSTGKDQCYFHCSKYRCCFQDDWDPISCHPRGICNQYMPCEKLEDNSSDENNDKSSIDDLCSVKNILIGGGYDQCENVCAGKMCCFDESPDGCSSRQDCADHEACSMLMSTYLLGKGSTGGAQFDVEKVCSTAAMLDTETKLICEDICEDHSCCFNDDNCSNKADCLKFDACKNLPSNQPSYPKPTVNMAAACNIQLISDQVDPFYEENCIDLCQVAECCRDNTCRHVHDFCEHYTPCYSVWHVEENSNLADDCTDDSPMGKAKCGKACEQWNCCWGENNCFSANMLKCTEAVGFCISDDARDPMYKK